MKKPVLVLLVCLAVTSCKGRYVEYRGYAQGGVYSVKVDISGAEDSRQRIGERIEELLTEIDTTFSGYNKASIVSRMNAGQEVQPTEMFNELKALSEKYSEISEGAFDVYGAPLFDIWGFGFKHDSLPDAQAVAAALQQCKEHKVVNFNAIAQGYTCDVIARYLHEVGIKNMLVNIGEIYCEGVNPKGQPWSIGIDTPKDGNNTPGASMSGIWHSKGVPCGVVTSGNYRKFYIKDGHKYAHTIDPRTGYPVEHNLLSATVVAPTAAQADAYATWFMVIGADKARDVIEADPQIEACLITSDTTWCSKGF